MAQFSEFRIENLKSIANLFDQKCNQKSKRNPLQACFIGLVISMKKVSTCN